MIGQGILVICGGTPVDYAADSSLTGVVAVVDKDLTAAEPALELDAERLLVLTDGPA